MYALISLIFIVFYFYNLLNASLSLPVAALFAGFSAYQFVITSRNANNDSIFNDADVESHSILTGLPISKSFSNKILFKEILKVGLSLFVTVLFGIIIVYWIMLSINPFWMRASRISKYETLHRLPHDINLSVREVSSLEDLEYYESKLSKLYPVVIKPNICTTNSRNVQKCSDYKCLKKYLKERIVKGPLNDGRNGDKGSWVIQEYSPGTEGVVFYYKLPYMSKGSIKNIGIREESNKISGHINTPLVAQYWPETFRTDFSEKYRNYFDDLASKIPGYTGGRFDIMLPSNFDSDLVDPRGTTVLELNVFFLGCIEEKKSRSVLDELKTLRTSLLQLYIGIVNIVGGYNYLSFWGIALKIPELISRAILCGNHEHLMAKP